MNDSVEWICGHLTITTSLGYITGRDELLAHSYSKLYNIPATGLRFFTVYGPAGRRAGDLRRLRGPGARLRLYAEDRHPRGAAEIRRVV